MKRQIPNIITLINLFCGTLAIYYIFENHWLMVCLLVAIAGIADFGDGFIARAIGVSSPIGKDLDSLADMVSFGVVPGLIVFQLLQDPNTDGQLAFSALPAFLIPVGAALRLARFNISPDTSGDFYGLGTPGNAALIIGLLLIKVYDSYGLGRLVDLPIVLYLVCLICPLLMTSNIRMFSLKFKGQGWQANEMRWIFVAIFIVLALIIKEASIFVIMVIYVLISLITAFRE
ncbi:MAG: CDP-alcohol phosphatidyltransferase family protein [Bacteroidia bacterium]|nr:CDP-alcohol phosphatidyltransferase family protein [Bacteroidia bacterium]